MKANPAVFGSVAAGGLSVARPAEGAAARSSPTAIDGGTRRRAVDPSGVGRSAPSTAGRRVRMAAMSGGWGRAGGGTPGGTLAPEGPRPPTLPREVRTPTARGPESPGWTNPVSRASRGASQGRNVRHGLVKAVGAAPGMRPPAGMAWCPTPTGNASIETRVYKSRYAALDSPDEVLRPALPRHRGSGETAAAGLPPAPAAS
jgi:hypothetical protein